MTPSRVFSLGVLAVGLLVARPAHAAPPAALVEVAVDGSWTAQQQVDLHLLVHRTLAGQGLQLVGPEQVEIALAGRSPASCRDDRCRIDLARSLGVPRLIFAHLRAESGGVTVSLILFNADVGERTATVSRFARGQASAALRETIAEAAQALVRGEPAINPARLIVRTRPSGASITVDGRPLGDGDAELPIAAGRHVVGLEKEGYAKATLTIEVRPGEAGTVDVVLAKKEGALAPTTVAAGGKDADAGEPRPGRPFRLAGFVVLGVGAATLATGVGLFAYSCTPEPGATRCPVKPSVRTAGRALILVGGGIGIAGAGLLAYDLHVAKRRARLGLGPAGASVAWEF